MAFLSSFTRGFAITPSDTVPLALPCKAIYVGGAGTLIVRLANMTTNITLVAVPVGTILPISPILVIATSTTATNLVGLSE